MIQIATNMLKMLGPSIAMIAMIRTRKRAHDKDKLTVAVVGTGRWAQMAHIPGWQRDPRVEVVALADSDPDALAQAAGQSGVRRVTADYRELLADPGIDVIDVVTGNRPHFQISWDALEAGKHVLCEKPVHPDYRQTRAVADLAASKGLKTKLGFTFRYAPAIRYARELIDSGFVGEPYIFNGYEQNSQWLDPATPLRQVDPDADPGEIAVSSIEGYGAPIIDIMHWWLGAPLRSVVGAMRNFVPERMIRDTGRMTRVNIDDGDMWIGEFASGALASIQSSYVTVGNYPGIEARIYGSEGRRAAHLRDRIRASRRARGRGQAGGPEPAGRKWHRPAGGELGPRPAGRAPRPGRYQARGSGRGHRPRHEVQQGLPPGLGDGRGGGPRVKPAARPRTWYHADPDRTCAGAEGAQ